MGYVARGVGAVARRPGGHVLIHAPRHRGFGLIRGRGLGAGSCPAPQYVDASTGICCAAPGTPAAADPCSILNNSAFLAAQAAAVGPVNPSTGVPYSAGTGSGAAELAQVAGYPNNVQTDAMQCWNNPGATFTDALGLQITCPSASVDNNGIFTSAYTPGQLAAMIAPQATSSTTFLGNAPFALPMQSGTPSSTPGSSYPLSVAINKTNFNVGDSWQIIVSGPPNASVAVSGAQNGTSVGSQTPMGTINSAGQLVLTGTFTAAQAGNWSEQWTVGGQNAGAISFSVVSPSGGGAGGGSSLLTGGGSSSTNGGGASSSDSNPFGFLTNTVSILGVSVPIWALGGGAIAALWLLGRK